MIRKWCCFLVFEVLMDIMCTEELEYLTTLLPNTEYSTHPCLMS